MQGMGSWIRLHGLIEILKLKNEHALKQKKELVLRQQKRAYVEAKERACLETKEDLVGAIYETISTIKCMIIYLILRLILYLRSGCDAGPSTSLRHCKRDCRKLQSFEGTLYESRAGSSLPGSRSLAQASALEALKLPACARSAAS